MGCSPPIGSFRHSIVSANQDPRAVLRSQQLGMGGIRMRSSRFNIHVLIAIRECCRTGKAHSARSLLKQPALRPPYGPLPGGRASPAAQDDLHAVLRKERDARDPLPEMREHGAPPEGEGSPERVEDFDTARVGISAAGPPRFRGSFAPHSASVLRTQPGKFRRVGRDGGAKPSPGSRSSRVETRGSAVLAGEA